MTPEINRETAWASDRIEAYLDGDLSGEDRTRFEQALEGSFDLREEVDRAEKLFQEIRGLPTRECPDRVTEAVLANTLDAPSPQPEPAKNRFSIWGWPGLGFAAAAAVVLFLAMNPGFWRSLNEPPGPTYTQAEIERAEEQMETVLAYIAGVGVRAGATIGEEIVQASLVQPVRQTARAIIDTKLVSQVLPKENKEG